MARIPHNESTGEKRGLTRRKKITAGAALVLAGTGVGLAAEALLDDGKVAPTTTIAPTPETSDDSQDNLKPGETHISNEDGIQITPGQEQMKPGETHISNEEGLSINPAP